MSCFGCKHLIKSVDLFVPHMQCAKKGITAIEWVDQRNGCDKKAEEKKEFKLEEPTDQLELFKGLK